MCFFPLSSFINVPSDFSINVVSMFFLQILHFILLGYYFGYLNVSLMGYAKADFSQWAMPEPRFRQNGAS